MSDPKPEAEDSVDLAAVRRQARAARMALVGDQRERASGSIIERLRTLVARSGTASVGGYSANGSEVDLQALLVGLEAGCLWLPRVVAPQRPLGFVAIDPQTRFQTSALGVMEPVGDSIIPASALDLVLIPLLAFDRSGTRVGYGGGYYDRSLAECGPRHPLRVGVAFACQEWPALPRRAWDQPLHLVVTEKEIIECPAIQTRPGTGC